MDKVSTFPNEATRRFDRRPCAKKTIEYMMAVPASDRRHAVMLTATVTDISEAGAGIETDYPLATGQTLRFTTDLNKAGVVRWCTDRSGTYGAGIEFVTREEYPITSTEDNRPDTLHVGEATEKYVELLDRATERFNREMGEIEKRCYEPHENPEELLESTQRAIDEAMAVCAEFERGVKDKDVIGDARIKFHEKTNPIMSKSYCLNRARTWPQGSQGDHKSLEIIYKNTPLSEGIGYYLDLCALNFQLGEGVRNRIKKLEGMLRAEIEKRQLPFIMNIGCGSCRELMGISPEIMDSEARIVCIDSDNDALAYAQDRLSYAGILPQVVLRKYNALRMFDDEMNMTEFGKQDIIYSVGLFDYLPDDFLVKLLRALYNLLNPGGKLIAAFKDASKYRSQDYHWLVDWDGFLQRKGEDFKAILSKAKIPDSAIAETREGSGVIVFYMITKQD